MKKPSEILKSVAFVTVASAVCSWVILSPLVAMNSFYNKILFVPMVQKIQHGPDCAGYPIEDVYFKSKNGAKLHGMYVRNKQATKTVLMSGGSGGNMMGQLAPIYLCLTAGANVLIYDYQGYGDSEGEPTLPGVVEDGVAAYDFLAREKQAQPEDILLWGGSLGTGVACQISTLRKVHALILVSPYTSILKAGRDKLGWLALYPDAMFGPQILNTEDVLSKPHPKTLLVHGDKDATISVRHAIELKKNSVGEVELITLEKAGHNDILDVAAPLILEKMRGLMVDQTLSKAD